MDAVMVTCRIPSQFDVLHDLNSANCFLDAIFPLIELEHVPCHPCNDQLNLVDLRAIFATLNLRYVTLIFSIKLIF